MANTLGQTMEKQTHAYREDAKTAQYGHLYSEASEGLEKSIANLDDLVCRLRDRLEKITSPESVRQSPDVCENVAASVKSEITARVEFHAYRLCNIAERVQDLLSRLEL
jgi:hypothetical protein